MEEKRLAEQANHGGEEAEMARLSKEYDQCLEAYLGKLGGRAIDLPVFHPLASPQKSFYYEQEQGLCSAMPFWIWVEETPKEKKHPELTNHLSRETLRDYMASACKIKEQTECSAERDALYDALERLIRERSLNILEKKRLEILKQSQMAYMMLDHQETCPNVYLCDDGNLMLDAVAIDTIMDAGPETQQGARRHLRWDRFQPLLTHAEEWDLCPAEGRKRAGVHVSNEVLKDYLETLLRWNGENETYLQRYGMCLMEVPDQEKELLMPFAELESSGLCPTIHRLTLPEHTVVYHYGAEQFAFVTYDADQDAFRTEEKGPFYVTPAREKGEDPDCRAMYNVKAMPEQVLMENTTPSPAVKEFLQVVCGGRTETVQELAMFFARVLAQDEPGLTVIHSKTQAELLQEFLFRIFQYCMVGTENVPQYREKFGRSVAEEGQDLQVAPGQLVQDVYLKKMLFAQHVGRSMVFLKGEQMTPEVEEQLSSLLRGEERQLDSRVLPTQHYHNRLHFVCITENKEAVQQLAKQENTRILDLTEMEYAEEKNLDFAKEDLHWFRTTFLLYGLKLRTLQAMGRVLSRKEIAEDDTLDALLQEINGIRFL